jgi:hypothetical protein
LNLTGKKVVKKMRERRPRPFVLVSRGHRVGDLEPALASQSLGVWVAEQRVGPFGFARSKVSIPTGGIGNVATRGFGLFTLGAPESREETL